MYYLQSRYYDPNSARFLNIDEVSYLNARRMIVFQNLYTYCNNSPVKYCDPNGYAPVLFVIAGIKISVETIALLAGCMVALIVLIRQLQRDLPKIAKTLSNALEALYDAIEVAIEKAQTKVQQRKTAKHHIIAKSAMRALPAKLIWTTGLKISINDSRNLVPINQNLHYFVHTKQYYDTVNVLVGLGYTKGREGVLAVVKAIRTIFLTINEWYF